MCPAHLELDSDHSSGIEWSSAMATPSSRVTIQESPRSMSTAPTTEEEEDEEWEGQGECPTTDESIRELRRALHTGGGPGSTLSNSSRNRHPRGSSLGFNIDGETNGKLVVRRTLFPKKILPSISGSAGIGGVAISSRVVSTITANLSPLVTSNWRSPEHAPRDVCTAVETGKEEGGGGGCLLSPVSDSQELFGTPVCTEGASSQNDASPQLKEDSQLLIADKVIDKWKPGAVAESIAGRMQQKIPPAALHTEPLHTEPLHTEPLHTEPLLTEPLHTEPLVCSTPILSITSAGTKTGTAGMATGSSPTLRKDCDSPKNFFIQHLCADAASLPTLPAVSNSVSRDYGFGERQTSKSDKEKIRTESTREDDVLDVLFMSSSQLETHFSLQHRERGAEDEWPCPSEAQPVSKVEETLWNFEEHSPYQPGKEDHAAVGDDAAKPPEQKRQRTNHFKYPKTKILSARRKSRIRTREVVQKSPKPAATIIASGSPGVVGDSVGGGSSVGGESDAAAEVGLSSPPVKKRLASVDNENKMAELEKDRLIRKTGPAVGDRETECKASNVVHKELGTHADSVSDIIKGGEGRGTNHTPPWPEPTETGEGLIERISQQSSILGEITETVSEDNRAMVDVEADKPSSVSSVALPAALSTKQSVSKASKENHKVIASPPSSVKLCKDSHAMDSQYSEAHIDFAVTGGSSINSAAASSHTDNLVQNASPSPQRPGKGFTSFMTAAGCSIAIYAAALDKATELVGAELGDLSCCGPSREQEKLDAIGEESLGRTGDEPLVGGVGGAAKQSSSSLLAAKSGRLPKKKSRGFKAPRMATSVSKDEERASLARILKGFGISSSTTLQQQRGSSKTSLPLSDTGKTVSNVRAPTSIDSGSELARQGGGVAAMGFQTAGGKSISGSRKSLQLAREIVSQEWQGAGDDVGGAGSSFGVATAFQTASGKDVMAPVQAIGEDKKMQVEEEKEGGRSKRAGLTVGLLPFPTDSNCSEKEVGALEVRQKAAHWGTGGAVSVITTGFKTAGGKGISVTAKSLREAKEEMGEEGEIAAGDGGLQGNVAGGTSSSILTGFQTASGKKLSVTSESIAKVSEAFQQEVLDAATAGSSATTLEDRVHRQAGMGVATGGKIGSLGKNAETDTDWESRFSRGNYAENSGCLERSAHALTGFQTASGRGIQVKRSSLQMAQVAATMESQEPGEASRKYSDSEKESREPIASSSEGQSVYCEGRGSARRCGEQPVSKVSAEKGLDSDNHNSNGFDGCAENVDGDADHAYMNTQFVQKFMDLSSEEEVLVEGGRNQALLGDSTIRPITAVDSDLHIDQEKTEDGGCVDNEVVLCPEALESKYKGCELSEVSMEDHIDISTISRLLEDSGSVSLLPPSSQPPPPQDICSMTDPVDGKEHSLSCGRYEGLADHSPGVDRVVFSPVRNIPVPTESAASSPGQESLPSVDAATADLKPLLESPWLDGLASAGLLPHLSPATDHLKGIANVQDHTTRVCPPPTPGVEEVLKKEPWGGLQTASGKPVSVSEDSMTAARALLGEDVGVDLMGSIQLDHLEMSEDTDKACDYREGSRLAGAWDKSEGIATMFRASQEAGSDVIGLEGKSGTSSGAPGNEELSEELALIPAVRFGVRKNNSLGFRGFSTAAGRKVEISEESLAAARKTLAGETDSSNPEGNSGNTNRNSLPQHLSPQSPKCKPHHIARLGSSFTGLQTAGGRSVEVRERSLQAAKTLLASNGDSQQHVGGGMAGKIVEETREESASRRSDVSFSGLQTASGKKVDVQKRSLAAAQALLGASVEAGDILNRSGSPGLGKFSSRESPVQLQFPGLQTASGKQVEVSRQSLLAAKITLGDSSGASNNNQEHFQLQESARNMTEHSFSSGTMGRPGEHSRFSDSKKLRGPSVEKLEYRGKDRMGLDTSHKSTSSRLREMQAKVQRTRASLTSLPEGKIKYD